MVEETPLPTLAEYGLSENAGFLPQELPVTKLSDEYYKQWETIANNLPSLILTRKIRLVVDRLPVLDVKPELLNNLPELRRAYSVLCFITNAYVWGYDEPCDTLPDSVAKPLLEISEKLGLAPLSTYASLVLWNFKPVIDDTDLIDNVMDLSNLTTINTFTGGMDESWFYLVSVIFEKEGSTCVTSGLNAIQAVRDNDSGKLVQELESLAQTIDKLGTLLMKMSEMCDPHIFYYRIRPFLAGWRNMADAGLPNGVKYGSTGSFQIFAGGSNAQSSLIQALDILLGVEHFPFGKQKTRQSKTISAKSNQNHFLNEMRHYMPREHCQFLEHLSLVSNIRDYVLSNQNNQKVSLAYDACLAMLKSFRDKHIQIVTRYIILQAGKKSSDSKLKVLKSGLAKTQGKKEQRGTGGTALIPFLKQCRDETGSSAASEWGKKVLSTAVMSIKSNSSITGIRKEREHDDSEQDTKRVKLGLAGEWDISDDSVEESGVGRMAGHW
ncbi:BNA2 (YJR078W) [Zygosaccharomyces parabailii]|nr:BNA2 (YJR078W) [Zygosaccharomyces parabailii]